MIFIVKIVVELNQEHFATNEFIEVMEHMRLKMNIVSF
jgi:hypothetical protein